MMFITTLGVLFSVVCGEIERRSRDRGVVQMTYAGANKLYSRGKSFHSLISTSKNSNITPTFTCPFKSANYLLLYVLMRIEANTPIFTRLPEKREASLSRHRLF